MNLQTQKRQRRCIACSAQETKGALHRFVRTHAGTVEFDGTGRAPGRGAYVCSPDCFAQSRKTRRLERALKAKMTEADYDRVSGEFALSLSAATDDEE